MILKIAISKQTGFRYFYTERTIFGRKQFSADCSSACVGEGALKATWHNSPKLAREMAAERGTLEAA